MVLIAALRSEVSGLRKLVKYCENPNSRRGMPSPLRGRDKKLDEEIARSRRPRPRRCRHAGSSNLAPMGH